MGTPKGTIPHNAGKGKGWIDPRGYRVYSRTVNGKRRTIREHRSVMEAHLGRALEPWEIVHHKDGNTLNNAIDNLSVMDAGEHVAMHHIGGRKGYDTRRTVQAFANMRWELTRCREINADLYAALELWLDLYDDKSSGSDFNDMLQNVERITRAALRKARP